ncbi:MAG: TVP38/TMEM64 family protein [Candidatus Nanoarchaeia archaeon]
MKLFSSREACKTACKGILLFAILVAIALFISQPLQALLTDAQGLRSQILSYGAWGPIMFMILHIIQVIIAPVPGQPIGLAGGYLFGIWAGTFYTLLGNTLGSWIVFWASRRFGRPFIEKVIHKNTLKRFDYVCKDKGGFVLFLFFLIPGLPNDAICYLAGLTPLKIRTLLLLAIVGRLPGLFTLSLIGHGIAVKQTELALLILVIATFVSVLTYTYRKELEKYLKSLA